MQRKIKVMIVDDSALVRQVIAEAISKEVSIELVASLRDPVAALEVMKNQWPDVLVVDIDMPRMDGLTFLKRIMTERPTPVIICSSLAVDGAQVTEEALALGAVAVISKPALGIRTYLENHSNKLTDAIKAADQSYVRAPPPNRVAISAIKQRIAAVSSKLIPSERQPPKHPSRLVAIGASTGGTKALEKVLTRLPVTSNAIVVVQHMPEKFTRMFADNLNRHCQLEVREAKDGDALHSGLVLIAPGGRHMAVKRVGNDFYVEVTDGPVVSRHKPSVDVLFRSVAKAAGENALGIILTGMGDDGARGLKEMHDAGAKTVAQDATSCVVFGMPREAIRFGGALKVLPLELIASEITQHSLNVCPLAYSDPSSSLRRDSS